MARITLLVDVELDPVPGAFHTPESAERNIQNILSRMIPHYKPTVTLSGGQPS